MPSILTILVSTSLLALTSAAVPPLDKRYTECTAGKQWYTCNFGYGRSYAGCCSADPCFHGYCPDIYHDPGTNPSTSISPTPETNSPTVARTTSTPSASAPTTTPTASAPTTVNPPPSGTTSAGKPTCTAWEPSMYNVYPNGTAPGAPKSKNITAGRTFIVSQGDNKSNKKDAILIFKLADFGKAPKDAQCSVGWFQPLNGTNFGYYGNGLMRITTINLGGKKFDEVVGKDISYEAVQKVVGTSIGQVDITFWPQTLNLKTHTGGFTPCAEEIAVYVSISESTEEESIAIFETVASDERLGKIGWFVSYDC